MGNNDVSLPDLNTENDFVKSTWDQWAQDVVANYSSKQHGKFLRRTFLMNTVDGMRIDAAKHVAKPFWKQFQPKANIYTMGEVLTDSAPVTCNYMSDALSGVLNYPMLVIISFAYSRR